MCCGPFPRFSRLANGERLAGDRADEAAYVLARMRFLLIGSPEPTLEGWGVSNTRPQRKAALDGVAQNLIDAAKRS